ncbi:exodeoxyribonuclease III [Flavobacteriaceae bacterium]|nr:exodeoxyribonuclease III [Flavobacteriaceae bacterium]MDC1535008.1 exodeoxyribonuclease III [Flavobacteriaceae bacterium]
MKIISYNVNGIRAAIKKGFINWLVQESPDVICLQEIKALKEQLDLDLFVDAGYKYNYWFSASKKGYSGVAILSKIKPNHVEYGTGIESMDFEGRNIRADFDDFSVMSLYLPSGTNLLRLDHKLNYMKMFKEYVDELKLSFNNLIIVGDYNICHKAIDIHDPVRNKNVSGFLPVERQWLDSFISSGFVDSFREVNDAKDMYSWWSYRANSRQNNKGWRIDYTMVTENLKHNILDAKILNQVKHSDHCPILVNLKF